jgi:hypothetical protein
MAREDKPYTIRYGILDANQLSDTVLEVINPAENEALIRCLIDGRLVELPPGQLVSLPTDQKWTIEFHRGGQHGKARYKMVEGIHTFTQTDRGWELVRTRRQDAEAPPLAQNGGLPENPLP